MKRTFLALFISLLAAFTASADEGMWMVNAINKALEAKMQERGLKLSAGEIYNADAEGAALCDAIISLDFACSGSVISDNGLIITNHHCAYADVYALSTPEHNYLEDGYWAFYQNQEIHIPHKSIQFLKRVIDVTDEANAIIAEYKAAGNNIGSRKLSYLLEKKYEQETGLEAYLSSMWAGSKYYLALYRSYSDIRLVAAPPVSIAAFGGDTDNWEWPQHKGDFAMYRIYTAPDGNPAGYSENNIPMKPERKLTICRDGLQEGDFTMVIGFPGVTNRYNSAAKTTSLIEETLPVTTEIRAKYMEIARKWMNADPDIRLLYSDWFFNLSNVQELYEGEVDCCHRFNVVDDIRDMEKELQEWIEADPERSAKWGHVIASLDAKWGEMAEFLCAETCIRELMVRSSKLPIVCLRFRSHSSSAREMMALEYERMDLRVERDLFGESIRIFFEKVPAKYWGDYHKELYERFGNDYESMASYVWDNSLMSDLEKVNEFINSDANMDDDPLFKYYTCIAMSTLSQIETELDGDTPRRELGREYTQALYAMREDKGIPQYPDANSTMRITYGKVGGYEPHDAVLCSWKSTAAGVLEKENPENYDFSLKADWKAVVGNYGGAVNFLTDNDITGGNSGSPVMNAKGELVGLAFDGNKESLASDVAWTEGYNKCVCVDIRYVLYILKEYAHLDRILEEIQ